MTDGTYFYKQRERAWKIYPYPCIGRFRFLEFALSRSTRYRDILDRLKSGQKLLDLGCCFGQDIRKLVQDGAPAGNLLGADLRKDFMELGYDLFLDRSTLSTTFFVADVFDMSTLNGVAGRIDIVHIGSFLHLFSWEKQREAAAHISKLLRRSVGSLIVGNQTGSMQPGEYPLKVDSDETMYRHNASSFEKLWNEVGFEFGFEWKIIFDFPPEGTSLASTRASEDYQDTSTGKRFTFSIELASFGDGKSA